MQHQTAISDLSLVNAILDLPHNGHTVIAWSMNNAEVSKKYPIGAPPFKKRLQAANKVQQAGYPLRIRLDPTVPFNGWKKAYAKTIGIVHKCLHGLKDGSPTPDKASIIKDVKDQDERLAMPLTSLMITDCYRLKDDRNHLHTNRIAESNKTPRQICV